MTRSHSKSAIRAALLAAASACFVASVQLSTAEPVPDKPNPKAPDVAKSRPAPAANEAVSARPPQRFESPGVQCPYWQQIYAPLLEEETSAEMGDAIPKDTRPELPAT